MKLIFQNSRGEERVIAEPQNREEVHKEISKFLDEHKKEYNTYFVLWRKGEKLGMLCQMSGDKIVDCWGNNYDATDVVSICLGNKVYSLEEK